MPRGMTCGVDLMLFIRKQTIKEEIFSVVSYYQKTPAQRFRNILKLTGASIGVLATVASIVAFFSGYATWTDVVRGTREFIFRPSSSYLNLFGKVVVEEAKMSFNKRDCVFPDAVNFIAPDWICSGLNGEYDGNEFVTVRSVEPSSDINWQKSVVGGYVSAIADLMSQHNVNVHSEYSLLENNKFDLSEVRTTMQLSANVNVSRIVADRNDQDNMHFNSISELKVQFPSCAMNISVSDSLKYSLTEKETETINYNPKTKVHLEGDCSIQTVVDNLELLGIKVLSSIRSPEQSLWFMVGISPELHSRLSVAAIQGIP